MKIFLSVSKASHWLFLIILSVCFILNLKVAIKFHYVTGSSPTSGYSVSSSSSRAADRTPQDCGGLTVDILSIGSNTRLEFLEAQRTSFGSHQAVRYFFNATEADDADPHCAAALSLDDVMNISTLCYNKRWKRSQRFMKYSHNYYASHNFLRAKGNPAGWLCAQARPAFGFGKVVDHYRQYRPELPDYLIIMDDDTYYNIELFEAFMKETEDPNEALAIAGCLVRRPIFDFKKTMPFGGFGMIFRRAAIANYIRPVNCTRAETGIDEFETSACQRVQDNQIGEKLVFQDGMSVSDLQLAYVRSQPYADYKNWSTGFCLHSDWMWGFFPNYYNISKHVEGSLSASVPWERMEGYNGSELYGGRQTSEVQAMRRICNNDSVERCGFDSHICHYQTPESMQRLTEYSRRLLPNKYKSNDVVTTTHLAFSSYPEPSSSSQFLASPRDYVGLTIDILSIGSNTRLDFLEAQRTSFGSHRAVRHFFNATEADDADSNCAATLSVKDVFSIANFCHAKKWKTHRKLMAYYRSCYATQRWLGKKANPAGWLCAQTRPTFGFGKVVDYYRKNPALPDYLIIMDDDSYYNIEFFETFMRHKNPDETHAIAGCIIRSPMFEINNTIPFGGFGMIFSRAALSNYIRPINCSSGETETKDEFETSVCWRVQDNQLEEKQTFQDGMSLSDLQLAYVRWQPYADYKNWSTGFCLHSDWLWGFFTNYYNISKHVGSGTLAMIPWERMEGYNGSEFYAGKPTAQNRAMRRICENDSIERCGFDSHICHYQTPESMRRLTENSRRLFPSKFN